MSNAIPSPNDLPPTLYCANHPNVETGLRCNNCGKPICPKCAKLTPTGYRCKDCLVTQQKVFDTARWYDYLVAFFLAAILAFPVSLVVPVMGFFTLFVAPIVGVIVGEAVRFAVRRRRSRRLFQAAAAGAVVGSLPLALMAILNALLGGGFVSSLWPLLWQALYIAVVTSSVYYRLRGIQIK